MADDIYTWSEGTLRGVLNDDLRVVLGVATGTGRLWIGVDARWRDDRADMANYSHDDVNTYRPEEVAIADDGLLTALHRHDSAACVDFRQGFVLRLPLTFINPLREVLAELAQALTEGEQHANA